MKIIALIPARLGATRFPNKMLAQIKGKSVIRRTYESAVNTELFAEVVVVSDSDEIIAEIRNAGGKAVKSKREYESGTDRIAEVAADMDADVFLNVQGDEPFVQKQPLEALLKVFEGEERKARAGGFFGTGTKKQQFIEDHNYVKVALDTSNNALFFSRSVIPYPRNKEATITYYEHIGVYAFRKQALLQFTHWPLTPLETVEKIECLRFLEHGIPMRMVITQYMGVEIDMPEDISRAEALMEKNGWK